MTRLRSVGALGFGVCLLAIAFGQGDAALGEESRPQPPPPPSLVGEWGGQGLRMVIVATGATLEYDCAGGKIDHAIRGGRWTEPGSFTFEPGPTPTGGWPPQRAQYTGRVKGNQMTVTATLVKPPRTTIGPYTVTRGNPGKLVKCE